MLLAEIMVATSAMRPRVDVAYCVHALARRLAKTHNWTVWSMRRGAAFNSVPSNVFCDFFLDYVLSRYQINLA